MQGFQENTDITWKPQEKKPFWTLVHFCIWCQDICPATHPAIINEGKMPFDYFHPRRALQRTRAQKRVLFEEITTVTRILCPNPKLRFVRNKTTRRRKQWTVESSSNRWRVRSSRAREESKIWLPCKFNLDLGFISAHVKAAGLSWSECREKTSIERECGCGSVRHPCGRV